MSKQLAEDRAAKIDEMIQKLTSTDPAERREAAYYLGEAAAGDAVETLIDVYENDEDRSVRKAAAYALGMFRAVERELGKGDKSKAKVIAMLDKVENHGKLGKRANKGGLFSSVILLVVLLALLVGLNLFIPPYIEQNAVALRLVTPTPDRREPMTFLISRQIMRLRADVQTLQRQYEAVRSGGAADCTAFFNNPPPLAPDEFVTSLELGNIAANLNSVLLDLQTSRTKYDQACAGQLNSLSAADVEPYLPTLAGAIDRLQTLEGDFNAGFQSYIPTDTPMPTATTDPFVTPSPTPAVADPRSHLTALYDLADSMLRTNGGARLLEAYWEDIATSGQTDGCRGRPPYFPDDYVLPAIDREASPSLGNAVDLINSGLQTMRAEWTNFTFACNSGNLRGAAAQGLRRVQTAIAAFQAALPYLDNVRDGI